MLSKLNAVFVAFNLDFLQWVIKLSSQNQRHAGQIWHPPVMSGILTWALWDVVWNCVSKHGAFYWLTSKLMWLVFIWPPFSLVCALHVDVERSSWLTAKGLRETTCAVENKRALTRIPRCKCVCLSIIMHKHRFAAVDLQKQQDTNIFVYSAQTEMHSHCCMHAATWPSKHTTALQQFICLTIMQIVHTEQTSKLLQEHCRVMQASIAALFF